MALQEEVEMRSLLPSSSALLLILPFYRSMKLMSSSSSSSLRWAFEHSRWTPSSSDWPRAMRCIDKTERKRIREFRYKEDAKASLVGKLSYLVQIDNGKWQRGDTIYITIGLYFCLGIKRADDLLKNVFCTLSSFSRRDSTWLYIFIICNFRGEKMVFAKFCSRTE